MSQLLTEQPLALNCWCGWVWSMIPALIETHFPSASPAMAWWALAAKQSRLLGPGDPRSWEQERVCQSSCAPAAWKGLFWCLKQSQFPTSLLKFNLSEWYWKHIPVSTPWQLHPASREISGQVSRAVCWKLFLNGWGALALRDFCGALRVLEEAQNEKWFLRNNYF